MALCRSCHTKEDRRIKPLKSTLGKKFTDDHKEKLRKAKLGRSPWNKGKKMTKEYCDKMSISKKGIPSKKKGIPSGNKGRKWMIDPDTGKRKWI